MFFTLKIKYRIYYNHGFLILIGHLEQTHKTRKNITAIISTATEHNLGYGAKVYYFTDLQTTHFFRELLTLPKHLNSPTVFSGVHVPRSLVLCVMFSRSLFVLLSFFFLPLCCQSFFDLPILISPFVSSKSSFMFRTLHPIDESTFEYNLNVNWVDSHICIIATNEIRRHYSGVF